MKTYLIVPSVLIIIKVWHYQNIRSTTEVIYKALQGLTKSILLYGHQEKSVKVLTSLLSNQLKRYYSTKDPKKITNPIPQNPEDCGCYSLPKLKSSKSKSKTKGNGGSIEKQKESKKPKKEKEAEETCDKKKKKSSKEDIDCNQQPPSSKACSKKAKEKEKEYAEEEECTEPREKEVCEETTREMEADCTQPKPEDCTQPKPEDCTRPKPEDCTQPKPQQIDCVKPKPKQYQPDCSKLKQAHICEQKAKAKEEECRKSEKAPPKPQGKLMDCCQKKKDKTSSKSNLVGECAKAKPTKPKGSEACNPNKSTALHCAKCLYERQAAELQSCTNTKQLPEKPKTIQCALGRKSKESKPVCKHRQEKKEKEKKKETCTTKPKKEDCIKPEQYDLRKPKIVTINPCGKKVCPSKEVIEEKSNGKLLKILGIPAVLLLIIGLLYEYGPPPSEAPPTN